VVSLQVHTRARLALCRSDANAAGMDEDMSQTDLEHIAGRWEEVERLMSAGE
jgi:hypothetical protein